MKEKDEIDQDALWARRYRKGMERLVEAATRVVEVRAWIDKKCSGNKCGQCSTKNELIRALAAVGVKVKR